MNLMIVDDHLLIRAGMKLPERLHLSVKTVDTHKKHIYENCTAVGAASLSRSPCGTGFCSSVTCSTEPHIGFFLMWGSLFLMEKWGEIRGKNRTLPMVGQCCIRYTADSINFTKEMNSYVNFFTGTAH